MSFILGQSFFLFDQLFHLFDKVMFHAGQLMDLLHSRTFAKSFIHDEMTFAGCGDQHFQQFLFGFLIEIFCMSETVTSGLQTADRFLECFFVVLSDAHNFADCTHLCSELIFHTFELLECPARKLDHHIVAVRNVFVQCSVFAARNIFQGQPRCKHCGYKRDRESGRFGCQCGRTGCSRVDLDDDITVCLRIMCPLYVCSADHLDRFHNLVGFLLKTFLYVLRDRQHRCGTERISGMYTERIDVLDEADCDHIVVRITHNFQLQLFPAENGFFYKHLSYQTRLKSTGADCFQFFYVVYETAACTAHRICRTQYDRITKFVCDRKRLVYGICHFTSCHLDSETVHRMLEFDTVLSTLDRVNLYADHLYVIFVQHACFRQF